MSAYSRLINFVNKNYRIQDLLLKYYNIKVSPGYTFLCPFHLDSSKSAKLFEDNHFYCFAEGRQYSSFDILVANGISTEDLQKEIPEDFQEVTDAAPDLSLHRAYGCSFSDEFRRTGNIFKLVGTWHEAIDKLGRR